MPDTRLSQHSYSGNLVNRAEHDLRACFRAGKTVPDWIKEDLGAMHSAVPDTVVEQLDTLKIQAERGDRLVVDLCAYIKAGWEAPMPERVNCEDLLNCAAAKTPHGWDTAVICECESVFADGRVLERALGLVVDNAISHHDASPGSIVLRARVLGGATVITVEDDGPEIPAEHLDRVFEPLTTLKSRDEHEGSGLGLAIARQLVTALGGTIFADLRPDGRGARITITLPN